MISLLALRRSKRDVAGGGGGKLFLNDLHERTQLKFFTLLFPSKTLFFFSTTVAKSVKVKPTRA